MFWRACKLLEHLLFTRHRKGRGIHSPYLFEFVHDVVFNAAGTEVPDWLKESYRELMTDRSLVPSGRSGSFGAGSQVSGSAERTVRSFVRESSVSPKYGALLYRIGRWFAPEMILELGTGLGVSTLYLSAGSPGVPLHSLEGDMERAALAAQFLCRYQQEQVSIHWGELDLNLEDILSMIPGRFLAFLDANHQYASTVRYAGKILERAGEEAIIVMDDIYWSPGMYRAWKEVISWPQVRISIDMYRMGILLLRKDLQKIHLKINY
jgi:predicted O-methyltransferase YrrM